MARWRYYNSNNRTRAIPRIEPRLAILSVFIATILAVVTVRLYYLQIIRHKEFVELADRNRIRTIVCRRCAAWSSTFDIVRSSTPGRHSMR